MCRVYLATFFIIVNLMSLINTVSKDQAGWAAFAGFALACSIDLLITGIDKHIKG